MASSIFRSLNNARKIGWKEYKHQLLYIGDPKWGRLVGTDYFGNKYYENFEEMQWRHRWIDYAQHDYNASQIPPEWHAWMHHMRREPPTEDEVMKRLTPAWKARHVENVTGTRGAFKTYSTVEPRTKTWVPEVKERGT
ncbi:NDUFA12-domain-containing protein [Atractiella rhizophila]|nr:NDUFA12-domain-containing protein [Atractiella rhizophila]